MRHVRGIFLVSVVMPHNFSVEKVNVRVSQTFRSYPMYIVLVCTFAVMPVGAQTDDTPQESAPAGTPDASITATDNTDAIRSAIDEWRETLLYGINSEIAELIPTLRQNGEEELLPEIAELFAFTTDADVLREAARYLQEFSSPAGHERALELIRDNDPRQTDELTVAILGYVRETDAPLDDEAVATLLTMARRETQPVAMAAVRLLGAAGIEIDTLVELYRENDISDDVRGQILLELGERGDAAAFEFVSEILNAEDEATTLLQRYALDTLGRLGDERALPTIMRQMRSSDALTRAYAVSALRSFETDDSSAAIRGALRDEFWRVRVAALETVAERAMKDALPAVLYMARRDPEQRVRLEAIRALVALDEREGWELLEERVESSRTSLSERSLMIEQLLTHRPRRSEAVILRLIETEWERQNSAILDAIGRVVSTMESGQPVDVVGRLLDHPNFIIQIYGLRAVGRANLPSYREIALARAEDGNHPAVRSAALRALEQMGIAPPIPGQSEDSPMDEPTAPEA